MTRIPTPSPSKTCDVCGELYWEDDSNCTCPPSFEEWKTDLTTEQTAKIACEFYQEKIGKLCSDYSPDYKIKYELADEAEDFILEFIVAGDLFEGEFQDYLKKAHAKKKVHIAGDKPTNTV